jgi:hypothetical protein
MTIDFTGVAATRATRQVAAMMEQAGLRPHYGPDGAKPYRGATTIIIDEGGRAGVFGAVLVGARTGKILRAVICYGNDADPLRLDGYEAVRRNISSLLTLKRSVGTVA